MFFTYICPCCGSEFGGYVALRRRASYPGLKELESSLRESAHATYAALYGDAMKIEVEKVTGKLKTSANNLNDHVMRFRCQFPNGVKDVSFVIGISDFDQQKGCRVAGNAHAYIQVKAGRVESALALAESALDMWGRSIRAIPPPPSRPAPRPTALADFAGEVYGAEYITFQQGGVVLPPRAPLGIDALGWAYGQAPDGKIGWYPGRYVR